VPSTGRAFSARSLDATLVGVVAVLVAGTLFVQAVPSPQVLSRPGDGTVVSVELPVAVTP